MMALCSFSTVEQFWKYINFIPTPSQVFFDGTYRTKVDSKTIEEYSLFKKNIEPEWGDPANVIGGEWLCRQCLDSESLDLQWQNILLSAIGETMEELTDNADGSQSLSNMINGVRVVDKSRAYPIFRFEIWLSTRDVELRERVKDRLEEIVVHGQSLATRKQAPSKWEWKDHT
jgi:Eukaryotic initiation factor 4E